MKAQFTTYRPIPRLNTTEITAGGLGLRPRPRPPLTARWLVGDDGKLYCEWS